MGLMSILFGNKDKVKRLPTQSPEQQDFLKNILAQLQSGGTAGNYGKSQQYLSGLLSGSPEAYQNFAAPHITQFNEQVIPRLSERFAGIGGGLGGGALGSSGFGQAIGGAGSQLQSNLAALYAQLQQQAAGQAMGQYGNLANLGLGTKSFENIYRPGSTGLIGTLLSALGKGFGTGTGLGFGNKFMNLFSSSPKKNDIEEQDLEDLFGPNAGSGFYNPYTGYQG